MHLTVCVRSMLRCERARNNVAPWGWSKETCWSDFKCFKVKFYVTALVDVIIKVILQNARCNNKDIQRSSVIGKKSRQRAINWHSKAVAWIWTWKDLDSPNRRRLHHRLKMTFLPCSGHLNIRLEHLLPPKRNTKPYLSNKLFSFLTSKGERHVVKGTAHLIIEEAENLRLWKFRGYTRFPVSGGWMQDTASGSKENTVKGSRMFQYAKQEENGKFGLNF